MQNFKNSQNQEIQATQFGFDDDAKKFVQLCKTSINGEIYIVPQDLLGTPENAFQAVKTNIGFEKIQHGDWIIQKENEILVIPNSVFQLMFTAI